MELEEEGRREDDREEQGIDEPEETEVKPRSGLYKKVLISN